MKKQNISDKSSVNRQIKYPASIGVKDQCCTGINILLCVICQEKRKQKNKLTCGDMTCLSEFFNRCVKPDTSETRIVKTLGILEVNKCG